VTVRVAAAAALAHSAWGSPAAAVPYAEQALSLGRVLGDKQALVEALGGAANAALFSGSGQDASRIAEETLRLATEGDDPWTLAMVHLGITLETAGRGDIAGARRELAAATADAERSGNPFVIAFAALTRGRMAGMLRDTAEARQAFGLAGELYQEIGDRRFVLIARSDLGHALRRGGELDEAAALYGETIRHWQRLGNRAAVANQLESLAFLALARNEYQRSAQILGAAEVVRTAVDAPMLPFEEIEYAESIKALHAALEPAAFDKAWRQGAEMPMNEAIDFAVGR
jgi:ATP/maltotriose-dependent transcriptional regulator MalT